MKKVLKHLSVSLLALLLALLLVVGGYVVYLMVNYSRIPDRTALGIENPQPAALQTGAEYTALTYNIGFGAYDHDFSFFMDTGFMADGTEVVGKYSRARNDAVVNQNTAGVIGVVQDLKPDFALFQEADVKADRSHGIDQRAAITSAFPVQSWVYASNFHTVFLAYPLAEPHGAAEAGLLTLSSYNITGAERRSYPVDDGFPTRFFDLDRCFAVHRLPVKGGGELVLINSHMSAFDEGGRIRAAQLEMLTSMMAGEREKGNWVIVGGDFNHALCGTLEAFPSQQQVPPWVYPFDDTLLPEGYRVVCADNVAEVPTCRSTDLPYTPGLNYTVVVDGFFVSDNVRATATNIDTDFGYSDHNPVLLSFSLQ